MPPVQWTSTISTCVRQISYTTHACKHLLPCKIHTGSLMYSPAYVSLSNDNSTTLKCYATGNAYKGISNNSLLPYPLGCSDPSPLAATLAAFHTGLWTCPYYSEESQSCKSGSKSLGWKRSGFHPVQVKKQSMGQWEATNKWTV